MIMRNQYLAIRCIYILLGGLITLSNLSAQAQWVDSDGEISFIYTKSQQDSLTITMKSLKMDLYKKTLEADNLKKDLDYCKFNLTQHSNTNFIIEQSIPVRRDNKWLWLGFGSIGGIITCLLFVQ